MGDYGQAIAGYQQGLNKVPDITLYRHQDSLKQGFGLNLEQELPANFRAFMRAGWNEGHKESFAYTEMNSTLAFGFELTGDEWGRKEDQIGSAFETGGISSKHRQYLALGGLGFILGDGRLNYGREEVSETYYNAARGERALHGGPTLLCQQSGLQSGPGASRRSRGAGSRRFLSTSTRRGYGISVCSYH